jgi:small subunit ribosomal protein S6
MRKYELMYIINASLDDAARQEVMETLKTIVEKGKGTVSEVTEMGMREFAYEINHMKKGYYVLMYFEADIETVDELDRLIRLNTNIVRHMNVRLDQE